jgi:hypothetical protein
VVVSWALERGVGMLLMMEVVRTLHHPLFRVVVLAQPHVLGKYLLVVVIVAVEAPETIAKVLALAKTRKAMVSV